MSAEPGLRERKKQRTRADLERVAFELFTARGFDNVTIDEIAAGADVSKRTFYRYFESKEDVLLSDYARQVSAVGSALATRPADEPITESLRQSFLAIPEGYGDGSELLTERVRLILSTPSLNARLLQHQLEWEGLLAEHIATRLGVQQDDDIRPSLLAATFMAAIRVTLQRWILAGTGQGDLTCRIDETLRAMADLSGFAPASESLAS